MGPYYDRWSNAAEENTQGPKEIPHLEEASTQVQPAGGTDVKITQDQAVPSKTQTQEVG